jgi:hypothetical protein
VVLRRVGRTGSLISGTRRMDGAGAGLRGGALRVRVSAQVHHPGGVAAKVSGRGGPNPDRNQPSGKGINPSLSAAPPRTGQLICRRRNSDGPWERGGQSLPVRSVSEDRGF